MAGIILVSDTIEKNTRYTNSQSSVKVTIRVDFSHFGFQVFTTMVGCKVIAY